jgi:pyruvate-formate lyase-activating enzyme
MQIASHIQDAFQEYEDKHSLVLFCCGCNLNCPWCYNWGLTDKPIGTAKSLIRELVTPLHDAVVFLGGEPTIYRLALREAALCARNDGLSTKVYTNGTLPEVVRLVAPIVDAFSVDFKCLENINQTTGFDFQPGEYVKLVSESINTILRHDKALEIRTTQFDGMADSHLDKIKEYVASSWPSVKHIIQKDFRGNFGEGCDDE